MDRIAFASLCIVACHPQTVVVQADCATEVVAQNREAPTGLPPHDGARQTARLEAVRPWRGEGHAAEREDGRVRFVLSPPAAQLTVDGEPIDWFGQVVRLGVGEHEARLSVDGGCCEDMWFRFRVVREAHEPQLVSAGAPLRPASFTLLGAPRGAFVTCDGVRVSDGTGQVVLERPVWDGRCTLSNGWSLPVLLRAGFETEIHWYTDPSPD